MKWKLLVEQRAKAWERMKELNSGTGELNDAEDAEYRKLEAEVEQITQKIEKLTGRRDPRNFDGDPTEERGYPARIAGETRATGREQVLKPEQRMSDWAVARGAELPYAAEGMDPGESFGKILRGMATGDWRGAEFEARAMQGSSDVKGGYYLQAEMANWLIDALRAESVLFQAGMQTVPMTAREMVIATVARDPEAAWRPELGAVSIDEGNNLGQLSLKAKNIAVVVKSSRELVHDAPNAPDVLVQSAVQAMRLKLEKTALVGSGDDTQGSPLEPKSLSDYTAAEGIGISENEPDGQQFGYNVVTSAIYDIVATNAPAPTAWITHPIVKARMSQLKDGEGQWLQPPDAVKELRHLVTTQIPINDVVGGSPDCTRLFLGDFTQLYFGVLENIEVRMLDQAGYADNSILWLVTFRGDIAVAREQAFYVVRGIRASVSAT